MSLPNLILGYVVRYGFQVLGAVVILAVGAFLARWVGAFTQQWLDRHELEPPIKLLLVRVVKLVVVAFALLVALDQLGFQIAPLIAGLGVAGIGVGCLALGFILPVVPTIIAFVLGVIAAAQARSDGEETALLLARIAWIGALVLLAVGLLFVLGVIALVGTLGLAGVWHGLGPMDF